MVQHSSPTMSAPWHDFFDTGAIDRGIGYNDPTRLKGWSATKTGKALVLAARVHGSEWYETRVAVSGAQFDLDGEFDPENIESLCTCPVESLCKHGAALVMHWIQLQGRDPHAGLEEVDEAEEDDDEPREQDHRRATDRAGVQPMSEREPPAPVELAKAWKSRGGGDLHTWRDALTASQTIVWLLRRSERGPWQVAPMSTRQLKSGRIGVGKRFDSCAQLLRKPAGLGADDHFLAVALQHCTLADHRYGYGNGDDGILHHGNGSTGDVLDRLVSSGRLYDRDIEGGTFRRGALRQARLSWVSVDKGLLRAAMLDEHAVPIDVIPTMPPWYRVGNEIGPLQIDHPIEALVAMDRAPIDPDLLPGLAPILERHLPALITGTTPPSEPIPVLALHPAGVFLISHVAGRPPKLKLELATPCFRYGDALVLAGDPRHIAHADGSLVVRHLEAEERRMGELIKLGLIETAKRANQLTVYQTWRSASVRLFHPRQLESPQEVGLLRLPIEVLAGLRLRGWEIAGGTAPEVTELRDADLRVQLDDASSKDDQGDWFELHLGIEVAGQRLDLVPLLEPLLSGDEPSWSHLPTTMLANGAAVLLDAGAGRSLAVPIALLERLRAALLELYRRPRGPGGGLRASTFDVADVTQGTISWEGSPAAKALAERLRACLNPPEVADPVGLGVTLRPYQREGLGWLLHLRSLGHGALLADDMGLGKTIQVLASLQADHLAQKLDRPVLVVCPASMVGTWMAETRKVAPVLIPVLHHGPLRAKAPRPVAGEVLVTTYATMSRDQEALAKVPFHLVVCDEATALKNHGNQAAAAVRTLDTRHRLCLSGTPVENHLGELHAYFDWLVPTLLGSRTAFGKGTRKAVEKDGDGAALARLRRRIAPFVLRRTKTAVAKDLPARTESDISVLMGEEQRASYEAVRLAMDARVREVIASKGMARSHLDVLEALLRLRQVCCDPRLAKLKEVQADAGSAKLDCLRELLPELVEDGRRILVFSQFTSFLDLIEAEVVKPMGVPYLRLDGATRDRQTLVEVFQRGETPIFMLSLKAGGTGLTLTAADTVILTDPWWNPAIEAQAIDRAHRIGQDKPVMAYRLVASGTIEERIRALQARKRDLAAALHDDDGQSLAKLDETDLAALFAPLV